MVFWIAAALLTLGASLAVILPLAAAGRRVHRGEDHDMEVYRDQLSEVERDLRRGIIPEQEAEEARAEIGRRILRLAGPAGDTDGASRPSRIAGAVAAVAVLAVPIVSWGLYAGLGSPGLPGQPLSARLAQPPAESTVEDLIGRAEAHLAQNPEDGRGWDVLAPVYLRIGRPEDSATAYRTAIRLLGSSADRLSGLGEAQVALAGGTVTADAHKSFAEALEADASNARARFFLAVALAQDRRFDEAKTAWQAMLDALPPESAWRDTVQQAMAESDRRKATGDARDSAPGPSADEVAAADGMSAGDRAEMIETMVANLDRKLRDNPRDPEGWTRLLRSYVVLGKPDEAREALARALEAFGSTSEDGRRLSEFAASIGITATR